MDHLISAVRELRKELGQSQQAFATSLGMSIRAIANYEDDRRPTGRALYKLEQLARTSGRYDLAREFAKALATEMDWANMPQEPLWSGIVREIFRNEKLCPGWPAIARALVSELEALIAVAKSGMQIESPLKSHDAAVANLEAWLVEARLALEGSARKIVEDLVKAWLENNPGRTDDEARAAVWIEHGELYEQYRREQEQAAGEGTDDSQPNKIDQPKKGETKKHRPTMKSCAGADEEER